MKHWLNWDNLNMERDGCFIGVDAGTTAYKGVLTDFAGRVLFEAEAPTTYRKPAPDRVECTAAECVDPFRSIIRELAAQAASPILAVAISGAAGSTLALDRQGNPGTIISWLDTRSVGKPLVPLAGLTSAAVREITGWPCVDSFPLAQLAWRRENEPATLDQAAWIGLTTDFLQYQLTGKHVMDFSTATTLHLVDQVKRDYCDEFLNRLGLRREQLSKLADPGTVIGPVTAAAAAEYGLSTATVVVAGSFDHPSAALMAGVTEPGSLLLSCGTSFVGFLPLPDRSSVLADPAFLCDPFLSFKKGAWGAIFSFTALGRKIDDLVLRFVAPEHPHPFAEFDRLAQKAAEQGKNPVLDLNREYVAAPFATPEETAIAVMNGAARLLAERVDAFRRTGMELHRGQLVGGVCRSPIFPGIIAETTRLELKMLNSHAGARGAALWGKKGFQSL